MYTYIHTHVFILYNIYIYIYIYIHTYIYIYIYTYTCFYIYIYIYIGMYTHTHVMYARVCVYIYIYIYVYTHTHIPTSKSTPKHPNPQQTHGNPASPGDRGGFALGAILPWLLCKKKMREPGFAWLFQDPCGVFQLRVPFLGPPNLYGTHIRKTLKGTLI